MASFIMRYLSNTHVVRYLIACPTRTFLHQRSNVSASAAALHEGTKRRRLQAVLGCSPDSSSPLNKTTTSGSRRNGRRTKGDYLCTNLEAIHRPTAPIINSTPCTLRGYSRCCRRMERS